MIVTRAPLRIPLGGGGTDFPSYYTRYGGLIVGFAINKYVYTVVHPTQNGKISLKYSKNEVVSHPDRLRNRVAAECLKFAGVTGGVEICTFSDVPESSGLGGSSAFCVSLLLALDALMDTNWYRDRYALFSDAVQVERYNAGQSGGIQDQWFATYGDAHVLSIREDGDISSGLLNLQELVPQLKLVYTHKHRYDLSIAEKQDQLTNRDDRYTLESLHKVKSLGQEILSIVEREDYTTLGRIFTEHWIAKLLRDTAITTMEVDTLYNRCMIKGAKGGKLIGLGGGGYLLIVTDRDLDDVDTIDISLDTEGAKVVYSDEKVLGYV